MLLLPILTLCLLQVWMVQARSVDPRCQPMRIPWCLGVYDAVQFPNFLGHQTQEEAYYAMHKLWPLITTECSPQVLHYLCRLYAPQCPFFVADRDQNYVTYHPQQHRPPCEDACVRVRHDCHEVLWKHNIHWPAELECHNLRNKDCVETPQIEFRPPSHGDRSEPDRPYVPVPPRPTVIWTEPPQTHEPATEQHTEPPAPTEPITEEIPTPVLFTDPITPVDDSILAQTVEPEDDETTAPPHEETPAPEPEPEPVTEPETPEPETEPATEAAPEPEPEPTAAVETEPTAAPEPEPIITDATTGSALGINPVIQEGESGDVPDVDEATTEAAATEDGGESAPAAEPAPGGEEKSSLDGEGATVDPAASGDSSLTSSGDEETQSPRSDRAVGSKAPSNRRESNVLVAWTIIYLVTLSLIFHKGA